MASCVVYLFSSNTFILPRNSKTPNPTHISQKPIPSSRILSEIILSARFRSSKFEKNNFISGFKNGPYFDSWKSQSTLFLKAFFYYRYISDFHKTLMWDLEVTVFKSVLNFLWYSYLNERNNAKKFHEIAITCYDKQAAVNSIRSL